MKVSIHVKHLTLALTPSLPLPPGPAVSDADGLVAGDGQDALDALQDISNELGCRNTLEDILDTIDRLRDPHGAAGRPRYAKLDASFSELQADAADWTYVLDRTTNLVWMRGEQKASSWADAEKLAAAVGDGFRMPTLRERLSIVDYDRHEPAIDTAYFDSPTSDISWTSTPVNWNKASAAWCVYLGYGNADPLYRSLVGFVRAVRSGVPAGQ